jgi:hypothetical protein
MQRHLPTALPKFVDAQDSNPPSPRPSPPLTRGERAGSGGILHAQEFVNSGSAIGIISVDAMRFKHQAPTPNLPARGERVPPPCTGEVRRGAYRELKQRHLLLSLRSATTQTQQPCQTRAQRQHRRRLRHGVQARTEVIGNVRVRIAEIVAHKIQVILP